MVFGRYNHADGQLCFTSLVRPADSSPGSTRTLPPYPACDVFVRDQDRSLRFYLDQLGFSLVADYRYGSNERWVAVAPADGSAVLALVTPKPGSDDHRPSKCPKHIQECHVVIEIELQSQTTK